MLAFAKAYGEHDTVGNVNFFSLSCCRFPWLAAVGAVASGTNVTVTCSKAAAAAWPANGFLVNVCYGGDSRGSNRHLHCISSPTNQCGLAKRNSAVSPSTSTRPNQQD